MMVASMKHCQEDDIDGMFTRLYEQVDSLEGGVDEKASLVRGLRSLQEEVDDVSQTLSVMDMSLMDARMQVRTVEARLRESYVTNPGTFEKLYTTSGKELGRGKFGVVHECSAKWNPSVSLAVKMIHLTASGDELSEMQNEVRLLQAVRGPNVVQMIETFASDSTFYLVMEKVGGGELLDYLVQVSHYTEQAAQNFFRQLIGALRVLRHFSIVHRVRK